MQNKSTDNSNYNYTPKISTTPTTITTISTTPTSIVTTTTEDNYPIISNHLDKNNNLKRSIFCTQSDMANAYINQYLSHATGTGEGTGEGTGTGKGTPNKGEKNDTEHKNKKMKKYHSSTTNKSNKSKKVAVAGNTPLLTTFFH